MQHAIGRVKTRIFDATGDSFGEIDLADALDHVRATVDRVESSLCDLDEALLPGIVSARHGVHPGACEIGDGI